MSNEPPAAATPAGLPDQAKDLLRSIAAAAEEVQASPGLFLLTLTMMIIALLEDARVTPWPDAARRELREAVVAAVRGGSVHPEGLLRLRQICAGLHAPPSRPQVVQ